MQCGERRIDELNTILNADVAALRIWMVEQGVDASFIAKDDGILPAVESLLKTASDSSNLERALTQSQRARRIEGAFEAAN